MATIAADVKPEDSQQRVIRVTYRRPMSALGQKQTFCDAEAIADIKPSVRS